MLPKSLNIINNLPWRLDFCLHFFWNFKTAYFSFHKTVNQRHCSQCSVGLKIGLFTSCCSCEMILVDPYLYYIGGLGALWELYMLWLCGTGSPRYWSAQSKNKSFKPVNIFAHRHGPGLLNLFLSRTIRIMVLLSWNLFSSPVGDRHDFFGSRTIKKQFRILDLV